MKKKITKKEVGEKLSEDVGTLHGKMRKEAKKERNEKRRIEREELHGASNERQEWIEVHTRGTGIFPDSDIYPHGINGHGEDIAMTDPDCHCDPVSVVCHRSFLTGRLPYDDYPAQEDIEREHDKKEAGNRNEY